MTQTQVLFLLGVFQRQLLNGKEDAKDLSEVDRFKQYFEPIVKCDVDKQIYNLVWQNFTNEIRAILENEYIFSIFWKSRQKDEIHSWKQSFAASRLVVASTFKNGYSPFASGLRFLVFIHFEISLFMAMPRESAR